MEVLLAAQDPLQGIILQDEQAAYRKVNRGGKEGAHYA
jgi:hypothetical protein